MARHSLPAFAPTHHDLKHDLNLTPPSKSTQLDERFDALEARLGLGDGSTSAGAPPARSPPGAAPVTPGTSAKATGGTAAGPLAAFVAEHSSRRAPSIPGGGNGGGGGGNGGGEGGRARGQRRSSPMGASAGGAAAASASPGQGQGQGEGESSIMHVGLPSPTKLASKHFRRSPNANSTSTFGPYDA